jgi:SARP family transcriptional regulator, regulator of embCAB operon
MAEKGPMPVRFGVLGPLRVELGGVPARVGGVKPRLVLAMLLLTADRVVSVDRLIAGLWEEDPPEGAVNTLQVYISQLRRLLIKTDADLLTEPPGYRLCVRPDQLDLLQFEDLTATAREHAGTGDADRAVGLLDEALALWRGAPLDDLGPGSFADNARTFLTERRLGVVDDRLRLLLGLRRYREVVEDAEAVVADFPLRESVWEKLMVALYRAGRPADALARYRDCRRLLLEELGVEPMPRLRALEQQILNHDRRLDPGPRTDALVIPTGRPGVGNVTGTATQLRPRRLDAALTLPDGQTIPLAEDTVLGRHASCDVVLPDPAVSRRHAEIRLTNGRHVLLDLSSANGTWVAGKPVMQHLLEDGDTFELGGVKLHYRTH